MCQVLFYIQWCKSEQDRLLSLMAPMFWLITYMTQLTCLKVRLLTCEVRVTVTHRARMEFKWDNVCVTGCKNGTLHASWGMNSTDVTFQSELKTERYGKNNWLYDYHKMCLQRCRWSSDPWGSCNETSGKDHRADEAAGGGGLKRKL